MGEVAAFDFNATSESGALIEVTSRYRSQKDAIKIEVGTCNSLINYYPGTVTF
jgi:hypothetical protein